MEQSFLFIIYITMLLCFLNRRHHNGQRFEWPSLSLAQEVNGGTTGGIAGKQESPQTLQADNLPLALIFPRAANFEKNSAGFKNGRFLGVSRGLVLVTSC